MPGSGEREAHELAGNGDRLRVRHFSETGTVDDRLGRQVERTADVAVQRALKRVGDIDGVNRLKPQTARVRHHGQEPGPHDRVRQQGAREQASLFRAG